MRGTGVYSTPKGYPVKGNGSSRIYHLPGGQNYQATIPEICFATVEDARACGFRSRHGDPAEANWSLVEESPSDSSRVTASQDAIGAAEGASREKLELLAIFAELPPEGTGWVRGMGVYTTPAGYPVKGNASSRIYHLPGGQNYLATIPEVCFASVDDARAGGFRPRHGDPAEADWSLVEETPASEAMGIANSPASGVGAEPSTREEAQLAAIVALLPPEGSGWVKGTGVYTTPSGYPIKGNASSRIFHVPGGQNYQATIPEVCFETLEAAKRGGFRARHGDPTDPDWSFVEITPGSESMGIAGTDAQNLADLDPSVAEILATLPVNGSGWRPGDGSVDCPASHPFKGNASSKIFHRVGGRSYESTIPEFCFATPEDALDAGFRQSKI